MISASVMHSADLRGSDGWAESLQPSPSVSSVGSGVGVGVGE